MPLAIGEKRVVAYNSLEQSPGEVPRALPRDLSRIKKDAVSLLADTAWKSKAPINTLVQLQKLTKKCVDGNPDWERDRTQVLTTLLCAPPLLVNWRPGDLEG